MRPETPAAAALEVAERIRTAVAAHRFPGEETQLAGNLTISLGVATFSDDEAVFRPQTAAETNYPTAAAVLIGRADEALYRAQQQGRNSVGSQTASQASARLGTAEV